MNRFYMGIFVNLAAAFSACIAQGDVGTYDNGSITYVGLNAYNYFSHIGYVGSSATNVTTSNIIWSSVEASSEFSVSPASGIVDVWGATPVVAELSSASYSWSVTSDDWLTVTDLSGSALTEGNASEYVQYAKVTADANSLSSTREGTVTFTAKEDETKVATMTITQDALGDAFPSKWVFSSSNLSIYSDAWTENHRIPATSGSAGTITAVRGEKYSGTDFNYTIYGNKPTVTTMGEGDYWLYTFPVDHLDAGTAIEFDITTGGGTGGPKYFIVEYYDNGEWRSVEEDLRTASEDDSIQYTYMSSGDISSDSYQYSTVMQTVRLTSTIDNDSFYIRCRAVGSMTASGGTQDITATGRALFPLFGFTGGYVQNYGTATPTDTKTILCLGNSFSYYYNPVFMLKEIAYSQGHYIRMRAHLKGSQTLKQHCSLSMSLDAIGQETYDYAFIQDQSQNPAKYGQNGTSSILEGCTDLTNLILEASPSCQVILEETWAYSSSSYGGFGSYDSFDSYNEAGTLAMAQSNSTWVSPVGKAFKTVRDNSSVNLYYTDSKHQSEYGAYLKACVNYLVIYGEAFTDDVSDCGLDATTAAYLRSVAEETVLGNEATYLITR